MSREQKFERNVIALVIGLVMAGPPAFVAIALILGLVLGV